MAVSYARISVLFLLGVVSCDGGGPQAQGDAESSEGPPTDDADLEVGADVGVRADDHDGDVGSGDASSGDVDERASGDAADEAPADDAADINDAADVDAEVGDGGRVWGDPIVASSHQWTWIEFPESRCSDDTPTGLAVNPSSGASIVFIYLMGGGACWSESTCFGLFSTAWTLGGFDEAVFNELITGRYDVPVFDRVSTINPFRDAHWVFVPYCTGDVFIGNNRLEWQGTFPWQERSINFHGAKNIKTYLDRLVPTFADVDRVILAGSSAGGFGAVLLWQTVQEAFGDIPVDVLDDSGPPIPPADGRWEEWVEAWNPGFPVDCVNCSEGVGPSFEHALTTLLPRGRYGLITYDRDLLISTFFGLTVFEFEERLEPVLDRLDIEEDAHYLVVDGSAHTLLLSRYEQVESGSGLPLSRWLEQLVTMDTGWSSYRP